MNEHMARNGGLPVREDEQGPQRSGRYRGAADCIANSSGGGISGTLDASYYKGAGTRNGMEREFVAMENEPVVYPGVGVTSKENASNPQPGDPCPTISTDSRNYLVQSSKPSRKYIVRRLTPIECARLQGFPDWWCDGANGSDSAQYKLWGNGIALPCAEDVIGRIAEELQRSDNGADTV